LERHEIQMLEHRRIGWRTDRESDLVRCPRYLVRHVREHVLDSSGSAQPPFELRRPPYRSTLREEAVDVDPIAAIGRKPSSGRVWLFHVALIFETGHDATDRSRGNAEALRGEPERGYRLTLVDVGLHDRAKYPSIPFRQLRMEHGHR